MVLSRGRLRASTCWRISGKLSAADSTRPSSTATHCLGYSSISRDVVSERNCAEWVNAINSAHTSAGSPRLSKGLRSCSIFPPHDYWLSRCVPQRRVAACLAIWWRSTVVGVLALALPPVRLPACLAVSMCCSSTSPVAKRATCRVGERVAATLLRVWSDQPLTLSCHYTPSTTNVLAKQAPLSKLRSPDGANTRSPDSMVSTGSCGPRVL